MHRPLFVLAALSLVASACGDSSKQASTDSAGAAAPAQSRSSGADLTGAGATFPNPLYAKWFDTYASKTGVKINYQSIGSGGGVRQISEQTVDFGASDAPMSDGELAKTKGGPVVHIPTTVGAVTVVYNLPDVAAGLKLSGDLIAAIFQGQITKWNDARIVALNMVNLAGSPYVAGRPQSEKSIMQRIAVGISDRVNALTNRQVLVVDLMCDARLYVSSNYASDGFHPGDNGYAIFAEDALPALRDGAHNQPNTNCAQRRLFP